MSGNVDSHDGECFLHIINGLADAVFVSECKEDGSPGTYIEVNDAACEMLGFNRADFSQLSPYDVNRIAMRDSDAFATILTDVNNSGKTLFKTELLNSRKQWIPVEISSQVFDMMGGRVYFSVARNIELREKYEASIKTLVRSTVGLTGQECLEEIVLNLSEWLRMEGACIGIIKGKDIEIRASYDAGKHQSGFYMPVENSPFEHVLAGNFCNNFAGQPASFSAQQFCSGQEMSGFIASPMIGQGGKVIGFVCAYSSKPLLPEPYIEDLMSVIASRAASECERMHFVRELSRSEERFRMIFNSTAEAIVGIDMAGKITFCNPSAIKILGYEYEADMVGKCFYHLICVDHGTHSSNKCIECPFIAAILSGNKVTSEDRFSHFDGHEVPVEYWGHPMSRDNKLIGAVVTFIDISRRKTLEKQLQHSQRMEAIGTLTGGIAHDFNNILTVISGYVGLLQSQTSDNPKLLSRIMKIGEAAERGSKLTNGLLAYSRKKSDPSTPVDLNQLVIRVQDFIDQIIGESIKKTLTLSEQSLVVLADESQIEQVLVNLATNARDAMRGGGSLSIMIEQVEVDRNFCQGFGHGEPGDYALITVADTGIGIPKDIQQKIFDPFFTTKDTGKGTGLGLAMVWGIIKQHKGYVVVESAPGSGTRFKIYMPLTDQPAHKYVEQVSAELPGGNEMILLVEDDPLVCESTKSILTTVGYRVVASDCAESALQIIAKQENDFSLILSDVVMPGIKGHEFYQEIRKKTAVPVIFISGYTFDYLRDQGLLKEGVMLLNKPIQPIKLLTEIRNVIDVVS